MLRWNTPLRTALASILVSSIGTFVTAQDGLPQPGQTQVQGANPSAAGGEAYSQQVGYMIGQDIGANLRTTQIQCDLPSLLAGISDALQGAQPRWTQEQLNPVRERFQQEMQQKAVGRMQQAVEQNAREAQQFLAQNKTQSGVETLPSGLQYKVLKSGTGPSPGLTDKVRCHYRGTFIDGTEFDSSHDGEPAEFGVNQVIPGWTEALQKMKVGDKWQLVVPADLAYGVEGRPGIPPNSLLIFEVELLDIPK